MKGRQISTPFTIMDVFLILTCDLEVSPVAGDAAAPVGGPAPVLPAVRSLLALLGAQEKQTVVRQQDSETWGQFKTYLLPQLSNFIC